MGTAGGQRRFEDFVDLVVGREGAMSMLAIGRTAGPSSGLGVLLGLTLGERRGLPLVGTLRLFELSLEPIAFGLEAGIALLQFGDSPIASRASRADRSIHTVSVAKPPALSCATFVQVTGFRAGEALHKHFLSIETPDHRIVVGRFLPLPFDPSSNFARPATEFFRFPANAQTHAGVGSRARESTSI